MKSKITNPTVFFLIFVSLKKIFIISCINSLGCSTSFQNALTNSPTQLQAEFITNLSHFEKCSSDLRKFITGWISYYDSALLVFYILSK